MCTEAYRRELHKFICTVQPKVSLFIRSEISHVMKGCTRVSFAGKGLLRSSFWSAPQLDPCGAKDHHRKPSSNRVGGENLRTKLPNEDSVRGFSDSNDFRKASYSSMLR